MFNHIATTHGQFRSSHFAPPQRGHAMPLFGGGFNVTNNITIKNGIGGFGGFALGLLNGLSGDSGFNNFGMNNFAMNGFAPIGFGNYSPFAFGGTNVGPFQLGGFNTGNGTMATNMFGGSIFNTGIYGNGFVQQEKSDLKSVYKDYTILDNRDGTYSLTKGDGTVSKTGTFEELMDEAKKAGETSQGTESGSDDNSSSTAANPPASGSQASGTQTSGTQTSGTQTSGTQTNGSQTSGTQTSGTQTSGTQTNGSQTTPTPPTDTKSSTPEANKITKDTIATDLTKGKKASVLDLGTGRDFAHYTISTVGPNNSDGFPTTILLKGENYWNDQTMTFIGVDKDGVAHYRISTGKKPQEYRLEKHGDTIKFTQREGDDGYGKANWNVDG